MRRESGEWPSAVTATSAAWSSGWITAPVSCIPVTNVVASSTYLGRKKSSTRQRFFRAATSSNVSHRFPNELDDSSPESDESEDPESESSS